MKNSLFNLYKDKWLILLCIFLGFLAWQGIRKNIGFEVSVSNVAVDVDIPPGWAVSEKSAPRVSILFRGSREDIRYLNNEQLRVIIPVPEPQYGKEMEVRLSEKLLKNPTSAKVVRFNPSTITLKLDQEIERRLPVKAMTENNLPAGLQTERIISTPASVVVSGAREMLESLESIHTKPVDLKDRNGSFKESVQVALLQPDRMRAEPDWITVEVVVAAHTGTKQLEKIPVQVMSTPGESRKVNVTPQTINVTVRGPQQKIETLQASSALAYVSCTELTESTGYDLPVVVDLPEGIQLVNTEPAVVHVEIGTLN